MRHRRDDRAIWMLVGGAIIFFASVIGFAVFLTYPYRQAANPPETKPAGPGAAPPAITRPVETAPETSKRASAPRHHPRPVVSKAPVTAERPPPPDCAGQTGHNFGPCPGYVHPYLSLQSPGDSAGASSTGAAAAASSASSGHGGHGGHGGHR